MNISQPARHRHLLRQRGLAGRLVFALAFATSPMALQAGTVVPVLGSAPVIPESLPNKFPTVPQAPPGAPNILLVLTDDVGFGAASAFGGPIPTPNLERLRARGLTYNRFHTTAMCSPTRAALLTGRNPHMVGTGVLTDFAMGAPGYNGMIPRSAATVGEVLRQNGYSTGWFGKHHNVPNGPFGTSGPQDYWPVHLGFNHFLGFIGSDTDQFRPVLYRGLDAVIDDKQEPILDQRLTDDAIAWIHQIKGEDPDRPFFAYLAPGSAHTPNQAPPEWLSRFRGKFDGGWDAIRAETLKRQIAAGLVPRGTRLPPWPDYVPRWDSLPVAQKAFHARQMEAFAAQLSFQDAQFGRIMDELARMGIADNTLVIFIEGDNGSDAAGSPRGSLGEGGEIANKRLSEEEHVALIDSIGTGAGHSSYGTGWALAMSTPFPYYKQIASHLGGTRNGMVISWPERITQPGLRTQYHFVSDIAPTIYEAVGIVPPTTVDGVAQQPIDGISLVYSFKTPTAPGQRKTQYFEMLGNRAIYHDGWIASTVPVRKPWEMAGPGSEINLAPTYGWQLFDLDRDFNQSNDLSTRYPAKLIEMQALFDREARANQVDPLNDRTDFARTGMEQRFYAKPRQRYVYWGSGIDLRSDAAPPLAARSFRVDADIVVGDGTLAAYGSELGGWAFAIVEGRPTVRQALSPLAGDKFTLRTVEVLTPGVPAKVSFDFRYDGGGFGKGGTMRILIDGREVATGHLDRTTSVAESPNEHFTIGYDGGQPVIAEAGAPFRFTGELRQLAVTVGKPGQSGPAGP